MLDDEERARRFEALVDADPDFIAIASVDGKVDYVNRAGRRLVGVDEDADLATTSILDFLTPEGLLASVEHEQPAVVRDGHWSGTSTLRDWRDDSGIPVAVSSFLLRDVTTDEPLAMATIQRDLRESLRAAEAVDAARAALVASEQRHEALLLHMSDLVMVVSAEGDLSYASPFPPGGSSDTPRTGTSDRTCSTTCTRRTGPPRGSGWWRSRATTGPRSSGPCSRSGCGPPTGPTGATRRSPATSPTTRPSAASSSWSATSPSTTRPRGRSGPRRACSS